MQRRRQTVGCRNCQIRGDVEENERKRDERNSEIIRYRKRRIKTRIKGKRADGGIGDASLSLYRDISRSKRAGLHSGLKEGRRIKIKYLLAREHEKSEYLIK